MVQRPITILPPCLHRRNVGGVHVDAPQVDHPAKGTHPRVAKGYIVADLQLDLGTLDRPVAVWWGYLFPTPAMPPVVGLILAPGFPVCSIAIGVGGVVCSKPGRGAIGAN